MRRGILARISIAVGSIFLLAAALLCGYNFWTAKRAETISDQVGSQVQAAIEEAVSAAPWAVNDNIDTNAAPITLDRPEASGSYADGQYIPDFILNPEMDMPAIEVDGTKYLGMLSIPDLGLSLPVASEWSYEQLECTPCCFTGTAYMDNLVIMAHNYRQHFGRLNELRIGAEIQLTDADGNQFNYHVAEVEVLQPTDLEKMTASDYPLTLFTCTIGGQTRFTVRCEKVKESLFP